MKGAMLIIIISFYVFIITSSAERGSMHLCTAAILAGIKLGQNQILIVYINLSALKANSRQYKCLGESSQ